MAFWIRNTTGSDYIIDDLGTTLLTLEERDLHVPFSYDEIQSSADLLAGLTSGDLVRLDGEGGSIIPLADAYDDAVPTHALGADAHTDTTLADLNALVNDATLDDQNDSRDPNSHASSHLTAGSDPIDLATDTVAGLMSPTDKDKLDDLSIGNLFANVRNETGSTIATGKLVASAGWSVVHDRVLIRLADKDDGDARPAIGVLTAAVDNNANGQMLIAGRLTDTDTSSWLVTDQLVLGNNGDFSRPPPDEDPFTGEVQNVGSVTRTHATEGVILFIPDGMNAVTAQQIFALVGSTGTPSKTNPYVTDVDYRINNPDRYLYVGLTNADYTSIKDAIDAAIAGGATTATPWEIKVYPGTYAEDPMTLPPGVAVTSISGRIDTVLVTANNSAQDLVTCTGGYIAGLKFSGVTDATKAILRMATASALTVLHGVSINNCSTGIAVSNGASVVTTDLSINITGAGQAVTTGVSVTGAGSYFGAVGAFLSAPSAVLPVYTINPIQTGIYVGDTAEAYVVGATIRIANKDTTPDAVLADGGSKIVFMAGEIATCYRALRIGSVGSDTTVVAQGTAFSNTINGQNDSVTGTFLVNAATDDFKWTSVAGSKLTGMLQSLDRERTFLVGDLSYRFTTEKELPLEDWFHDQTSTGLAWPTTPSVTAGSGLTVDVVAAEGWITRHTPDHDSFYVSWDAANIAVAANETNYIGYNSASEALVSTTSEPGTETIVLAVVVTNATDVRFVHQRRSLAHNVEGLLQEYLHITRDILLKSGLAVSGGTLGTRFEVGSGSYYHSLDVIAYAGSGGDATFSYFYGANGATEVASQTDVDILNYDSSGTLTAMTAGYYRSDTVLLTSDGRISVIYGTAEFDTQAAAEGASAANTPTFIEESAIRLARLVVQQGNDIVAIVDERPTTGVSGSGGTAITVHGDLSGLSADDHTQYLLTSGSRDMAGSLNMGAFNITNVGTVDGVDVSAHAARHLPGGADALTTGTPVATQLGATPAEGAAADFARSDHQHGITAAAPSTVGTANAEGSASTASRSDHVHAHGDQTSGTLHAVATTSVNGFMSDVDKTKLDGIEAGATNSPLSDVAPVDVTKAAASAGTATEAARQDHKHDITVATPPAGAVAAGNSAAEGTSTSLARADHVHAVSVATPVSVAAALAEGAAATFARADHVHTGLTRDANDFTLFTPKTVAAETDVLLIEDSEAAFVKKRATIQQIRDGMIGVPLQSEYVGLATNVSTNSGYSTYVDMPGMSTTIVTTNATSILRVELTCCYTNSNAKNVYFRVLIDGARTKGTAGSSASNALQTAALTYHYNVTAGSHPIVLQWCVGGGTATCEPVGGLGSQADYHHCSLLVQELA